MTLNE